jgi:hypothetical protein
MRFKLKPFLALALLLAVPLVAVGRIRPIWTYELMRERSDLVVIAKPVSSTPTEEKISLPDLSPATRVVGVETRFEVRLVLKGSPKTKNVCLDHYALENPADSKVRGAPHLVTFDPKQQPPACYLMFLKQVSAGRYVPVTGQIDPAAECIIKLESDAQ